MVYFFVYFLLLASCLADTLKSEALSVPPLDWKTYRFLTDCTLFDIHGEKKVYPGNFCSFQPDGTFLSVNGESIKSFSGSKALLWETKGYFHHQVNLSSDHKKILLLKSEIREKSRKRIRDDVFVILDMKGNLLHSMNAVKILEQASVKPTDWDEAEILKRFQADFETSHFNSIYEIPENKYSNQLPWMKAGNIIVNSYSLGIFILSPDLQKVLYHKELSFSNDHEFHDVQVTKEGEFLLFNNYRKEPGESDISHSAIQKYDPVLDKLTFEFTPINKSLFYSPACGGVQEFPEFIFFSHITNGGFFYSKEKKKITFSIPGYAGDPRAIVPAQQIKIVDVREFLEKSK